MLNKIVVVFKTHFDIGFTELSKEIIQRYSDKMLNDVIETCLGTQNENKDKEYVWTMSAWPLIQTLKNAPEDKRKIAESLIERGQLTWHALPYTTHTEFLGLNELCNITSFAQELCDKYNKPMPISAKMTDVPGHSMILPSILGKAGVKFMHIGVNAASMPVDLPMLFWWEGMDGERVLTFYSKGGYGSSLLPPKDWKYPVWLALQQSNDNIGPQSPTIVKDLQRSLDDVKCDAYLKIGTMDDFYNEIIKYDLSDLPVIKQDFADTWIHGIGTYSKEVGELRRNRLIRNSLEKAKNLLIGKKEFQKEFKEIDEISTLFGEHTWGLDVKSTLGYDRHYLKKEFNLDLNKPAYKRILASWNEQRERSDFCIKSTNELKEKIASLTIDNNKEYITLFNPNAKQFNGYVEITEFKNDISNLSENGKAIKLVRTKDRLFAFVSIKPLSLLELKICKDAFINETINSGENDKTVFIKNEFLSLEISKKTGLVTNFIDSVTSKNWAKAIGAYQYNIAGSYDITQFEKDYIYRFYDWAVNDFGRMSYPVEFEGKEFTSIVKEVALEQNSIKVVLNPKDSESVVEYGNAKNIEIIYTLLGNKLNIMLKLKEKQATPFIEGGNFVFDLNINKPKYLLNKVGNRLDVSKDIAINANNELYCLENWIDASDGKDGISIRAYDSPLFSIGEQALYKFSGKYVLRDDCKIYFNLFNNMWGTNFPQWQEGDFTYEFDVIPHQKGVNEIISQLECEVNAPIVLGNGKILKPLLGDIEIEGGNLIALFSKDNNLFLRVQESDSKDKKIKLKGNLINGTLTKCNLNCVPIGKMDSEFSTEFMEIHTIRL